MTPSVAVQFSAAADARTVTVDDDAILIGAHSSKGYVISTDPKATVANQITAPSNVNTESLIVAANGFGVVLNVPVSAGSQLFVSCNGAGSVVLNFDLTPSFIS